MYKPYIRPRRLRGSPEIRSMVRETQLTVDDLIYPLFVTHEKQARKPIPSMPGQFQLSLDNLIEEVQDVRRLGIPAIILFGIPEKKDATGSDSYDDNGIIQQAVRAVKESVSGLMVITDVCFCEYTDHGHCGVIKNNDVDNDATLELLAKQAVSHAKAGAEMVAPSGMIDGMVGAIRQGLDEAGFEKLPILSYAVKYSSSFYGPFRDAAESAPRFGDRRTHQMDPANVREALREAELDLNEGADMLMVKPALSFLDVIRRIKDHFDAPLAAYNVSGEYSMVKAAGQNGWIDEKPVTLEILTSIKRAGADLILTYHAKDVAKWLG
ncbi:porphobilinogen synthase [candidate division KSB1 bacterium]|nr:porphobilinogen synthase [candidate division KSB1 bacterium]NIR73371.1 porphobilinogen synthase [candidate division KSB1 bacterium]NIS27054.1 porphobilinogen synthase [candidate division KSB1 bacterium]NIT73894.1 porphobilinogen synthase [candidate division KSB1 bacterium]NIU27799.1 porphobilinogen synthase [candidate division KSB1 bacterium]